MPDLAPEVDLALWYERTKDIPWAREAYDGTLPAILEQFRKLEKMIDEASDASPGDRNAKLDEAAKIIESLEADPKNVYWGGTGQECMRLRAHINFWRD